MIRFFLFFFLFTFAGQSLYAQPTIKTNKGPVLLLNFSYGYEFPGGDLADIFGANSRVGGGFEFMTGKGNFIFGADIGLMFGNIMKQDVLASLRTPNFGIIANNKIYADIIQKERGLQTSLLVGKLFSLPGVENKRSGIRATIGMGILQHKVRIQESFNSEVPQVEGEYLKGYDKLTNGLMIQEFIGWQHLGENRLVNFHVGIQLTQAFTQNRRDWDFAERRKIDDPRTDLLFGLKVGWTLPFYVGQKAEEIFY